MKHGLLSQLASLDLPGTAVSAPVSVPNGESADFVAGLERERLLGFGVRAVEDGALEILPEAFEKMCARHDAVMSQTMRTELMAVHLSEMLTQRGIWHRLLKGSALAHTVAGDPSERSFRDVDMLIPGPNMADVVALCEAEGATRLRPELRPGFDRRFGKSVTLRLNDVEIDLHRLLASGPFGVWMRPGDLFVLMDRVSIAGREIPTLDTTDHLIHACYHVALGQPVPVLSNLRDVMLLAATTIDWDRFNQTIVRWRGKAVMQRCVKLLRELLDVELPEHLAAFSRGAVLADERIAINPYLTEDPQGRFSALAPATLRALPMADRGAFALAVGYPDGSDPIERTRSMVGRVWPRA